MSARAFEGRGSPQGGGYSARTRSPQKLLRFRQRLLTQLGQGDARGERLGIGLHMNDRGLGRSQRALEGRLEVGGLLHRLAVAAEGAGIGREVGGLELDAVHPDRKST